MNVMGALNAPSIFLAYSSISGNTREVAEIIRQEIENKKQVNVFYIDGITDPPKLDKRDILIIGSYTWGAGQTPSETKNFVADLGIKPDKVFVFGTGDTQFGGDEMFCMAADKLAKFYKSPIRPLKVEQSPRGSQEYEVIQWTKEVMNWLNC